METPEPMKPLTPAPEPVTGGDPSPGAARTRRWRERRREGVFTVNVEVDDDVVRALLEHGLLEGSTDDGETRVSRDEIGAAVADLVHDWAG